MKSALIPDWPILDIHGHTLCEKPETDDAIAEAAAEFGIDRVNLLADVLAFGFFPTPEQIVVINDGNKRSFDRYPEFYTVFCYVNPDNPRDFTVAEIEKRVSTQGFVGVKLESCVNARDEKLDPIMQTAERLGVPLLHHAWYKSAGEDPNESTAADIAHLASRFPNVPIIMAHLGGARVRGVQDIKPFPNVHIDTSGSQPMSGLVEYAVSELGEDRVLYGSDVMGRDFSAQLGRVFGARISDGAKRKILYENAARIIGL